MVLRISSCLPLRTNGRNVLAEVTLCVVRSNTICCCTFPRRTSQLLLTIASTLGRMEALIMFTRSEQTPGEQSGPKPLKLMLFYSLRLYNEMK